MIVNLRELDQSSGVIAGTDRVDIEDAEGEAESLECTVEVAYNQSGGAYYLRVSAEASLRTSCHRCLADVEYPISTEFDLVVRRGEARNDPSAEDSSDDFITIGAREYEVELQPYIHENLVVNVPMRIVCDERCKGLCPRCGANLNVGACGCREESDPRWNALRDLSKD